MELEWLYEIDNSWFFIGALFALVSIIAYGILVLNGSDEDQTSSNDAHAKKIKALEEKGKKKQEEFDKKINSYFGKANREAEEGMKKIDKKLDDTLGSKKE